jgi:glycosyltransferase involved in cell wall biosynthesis
MRVLMLHNRYRAEGGEERAVASIVALLRRRGHEVELLERSSMEIGRARAARGLLVGGLDAGEVGRAVRRSGAEVVHAHNLHPLFGWRSLAAAQEAGARTVLHLHNFRLFCAIAVAYRDGAPCYRCRGANTLPGLRLRCRGSLHEAGIYAAGLHIQQPRVLEHADRVVVLSEATGARMRELGLPGERMRVLGNYIEAFASASAADRGGYALAAGRLVEYKGFGLAVAAARAASVPLVLAGAGPDEGRLRALAAGADVRFVGWVDENRLASLRAGAALALVPSRCEEQCPYVVLDAIGTGLPVLGSDRGGIPERLPPGAALPVDDADAWTQALGELWRDPELRRAKGEESLALGREQLSEERYYERLMQVYRD